MNLQKSREKIWFWPIVIALLSLFGLIIGLIFDGLGDSLAWLCLGMPTVVGLYVWLKPRASCGS